MKINGYWFGAGLVMLVDYIYYQFNESINYFPFPLFTALLMILFFGLAFQEKKQRGKKK